MCNTSTLTKLYLTLVRPILEYCYHVWDPFLLKDIELLESVQKFAVKVCTKHWREPYNYLQNLLKLPLLKDRRTKLKLTVVYKCLNGLMVMPSNIFFPVSHSRWNLRSNDTISLHQPSAHIYIHVSPTLCPYGTNCLRIFTTVSPFLLLNPLLIVLSW